MAKKICIFGHSQRRLPVTRAVQGRARTIRGELARQSRSIAPTIITSGPISQVTGHTITRIATMAASQSSVAMSRIILSPRRSYSAIMIVSSGVSRTSRTVTIARATALAKARFLFTSTTPIGARRGGMQTGE